MYVCVIVRVAYLTHRGSKIRALLEKFRECAKGTETYRKVVLSGATITQQRLLHPILEKSNPRLGPLPIGDIYPSMVIMYFQSMLSEK